MPKPFRKLTLAEFADLLANFRFTRRINAVHMHHTWKPKHGDYKGLATIEGIWRFHTQDNGWDDIAQHVTIAPDGSIWTGRAWNEPPASAAGHNGNRSAGPFMFEMIGDFDGGRDPFRSPQRDAVLEVIARVQQKFDLPVESLRFHNQMSSKTCPGSSLRHREVLAAVREVRERLEREAARGPAGDSPFPAEARAYREKTNEVIRLFTSREALTDDPADAEHPAEDQPDSGEREATHRESAHEDEGSMERDWLRVADWQGRGGRAARAASGPDDWSRIAPFTSGKKQQWQPGGADGLSMSDAEHGGGSWSVIAGSAGKADKLGKPGKVDKMSEADKWDEWDKLDKGGGWDKVNPPASAHAPADEWSVASLGGDGGGAGRRRALCVGIDTYPTAPLYGCVADANAWAAELKSLGFEVSLLTNEEATRGRLVEALEGLVRSSAAGDVVVFQYAGHGTTVRDVSGDEDAGNNREDEALCPHDFDEGALIIDDDVAEVFSALPEGVNLTCFFDCCHSGTISRFGVGVSPENESRGGSGARPRFVTPTPALQQAHAEFRRRTGKRSLSGNRGYDSLKQVVFAACLDSEVAWESNGQGDFTRVAAPLLRSASQGMTNEDFARAVVGKFGATPRQHPELDCAPQSKSRAFLSPLTREGLSQGRSLALAASGGSAGWGQIAGVAAPASAAPPAVREALRTIARYFEAGG
ncbi:MAG TPA: caspase family protein [Pyrinomonadaceae bacterium]|nr:caspase family protein [Pyrinomonadaceae bacterium]